MVNVAGVYPDSNLAPGVVLTIRGNMSGLNWSSGQPLTHGAANTWNFSATFDAADAGSVFAFKMLIDDNDWSRGANFMYVNAPEACVFAAVHPCCCPSLHVRTRCAALWVSFGLWCMHYLGAGDSFARGVTPAPFFSGCGCRRKVGCRTPCTRILSKPRASTTTCTTSRAPVWATHGTWWCTCRRRTLKTLSSRTPAAKSSSCWTAKTCVPVPAPLFSPLFPYVARPRRCFLYRPAVQRLHVGVWRRLALRHGRGPAAGGRQNGGRAHCGHRQRRRRTHR